MTGARDSSRRRSAGRRRARRAAGRNEPEQARVLEVTATGLGLAALTDGRRLFVRGTLAGEIVLVRRTGVRGGAERAELVEILERSPARVEPACPYWQRCGGCDLMHADESTQQALHHAHACELLRAVAGFTDLPPLDTHAPGPALGYRTRARLYVVGAPGGAHVGYRRADSHRLTAIERCCVLRAELEPVLPELSQLLAGARGRGDARVALGTAGQPVVELQWHGELPPQPFARSAELVQRGRWAGCRLWQTGVREPAQFGDPRPRATGPDGGPLVLAPGGFAQPSERGAQVLGQRVAAMLEPTERLVELYAGSGTLSVAVATRAAELVTVERSAEAAAALRTNLAERALRARVVVADVDGYCLPAATSAVLLDPPREGARAAMAAVARVRPRQIVYVSCHVATLARDLGALRPHGYQLDRLEIVELFPQTSHFETIARLVR